MQYFNIEIYPENAVERNANIVGPHPRPFSRGEKGAHPLSPQERVGVRAKDSSSLVLWLSHSTVVSRTLSALPVPPPVL